MATDNPATSRWPGRLRWLVPPLIFAISLCVGWALRPLPPDDPVEPEPTAKAPPTQAAAPDPADEEEPSKESLPNRLRHSDQWLGEGSFAKALASNRKLLAEAGPQGSGPLHYRIALCQEGLGGFEQALRSYRRAVADPSFARGHFAAQLAQARLLLRLGRDAETRHLLYALLLASEAPHAPPALRSDVRYLLALALARAAPQPRPDALAARAVSPSVVGSNLPRDLADLPGLTAASTAATKPAADVLDVLPGEAPAERVIARTVLHPQPALPALDRLAKETGLRLEWTGRALAHVGERSLHLALSRWKAGDLFRTLADALDLVCQVEADRVRLAAADEVSAELRAAFRRSAADRALRAALKAAQDHELAAAASLQLGNLELTAGRTTEAAAWYEKAIARSPAAPLAVPAHYNLGLVLGDRGDHTRARAAHFAAVDHSPGHELAASAYLEIGRLDLETGEPRRAAALLRRAQANYPGAAVQPHLTLMLAAAYLLADDLDAAHASLISRRRSVDRRPYKAMAAALDALALYRRARRVGPARLETAELVATLLQRPRDPALGAIGTLLLVQACREVGLWDEAARRCALERPHVRGPLAPALQFAHAEALIQLQRDDEALPLLRDLDASVRTGRWANAARLELAAVDLRAGKAEECQRRCAELWQAGRTVETTRLLQLWGAALEQLGDYERAARCFSGEPPD